MERYQLRIKAEESPERLVDELIAAVWRVLEAHPELEALPQGDKSALREGLRRTLGQFVRSYDTCGLSALCEEAVQPAAWNAHPDPALAPRHSWQTTEVRRLALDVEKGLEELVEALEAETFRELFATKERASRAKAARAELGAAIQGALGPNLYRNVACGTLELCRGTKGGTPWA